VVDGNIIWKYMTTTITLGFNCNTDKDLTRIDPEKKTWEINCITRNIPIIYIYINTHYNGYRPWDAMGIYILSG
jgi:hypothetical protein